MRVGMCSGACADTHDAAVATATQVEPFSVKHEYEAPWDPVKPSLETCHPGRMQYVTHGLAPQVRVTDFPSCTLEMRRRPSRLHLVVGCQCNSIIPPALFTSVSAPNSCTRRQTLLAQSHHHTPARRRALSDCPCMCAQMVESGEEVIFSYDVVFKMSNIRWASRWDTYLLMMDDQIHWFSIVNSLMIVLFLSGMVAMIMLVRPYPLPLHNAQ
jgi:hypothetical protein